MKFEKFYLTLIRCRLAINSSCSGAEKAARILSRCVAVEFKFLFFVIKVSVQLVAKN